MSVLTIGSTGNSVIEWPELLLKSGYQLPQYGVDGQYGQETANATRQFQSDMGITPDGAVGIQTLQAMKVNLGLAEPESIPQKGGHMNLDDLTSLYKEETGNLIAPSDRPSLVAPILIGTSLLVWFNRKKWL